MAALARPYMHSSSPRRSNYDDHPTTAIRLGKRTRDPSTKAKRSDSVKKRRLPPSEALNQQAFSENKGAAPDQELGLGVGVPQAERSQNPDAVRQPYNLGRTSVNGNGNERKFEAKGKGTTLNVTEGDKRTLRSQDVSLRLKSELAWYFPDYEEIINDEPKDPNVLTAETRIHVVDDSAQASALISFNRTLVRNALSKLRPPNHTEGPGEDYEVQTEGLELSDAKIPIDVERVDYSSFDLSAVNGYDDSLNDELYVKAHRRAERQEKQLRNIEKERNMHEKVQLEQLLEKLRSHDWLKVMGLGGAADGGKKVFEAKRNYFIHEIQILLGKFREWKEEEKRRKTEKGGKLMTEDDSTSQCLTDNDDGRNSSDFDACAARQLHQEAISATTRRRRNDKALPAPSGPSAVQPFTSFFSKPHLRDAALSKRRRGRTRLAFGQPLPALLDKAFELPPDILTRDALAASARSRRRNRRESKV